ncbi:MAG TPA: TonB-dependent receptor [Opitutus sp.]|nr:TonB-dependent receptor [Opitutus sp.]
MPSFRTFASFLLPAALAAQSASPEPRDHRHDEPVQLENVLVTASPYARSQTELAQPTSVLAGRELVLHQSTSLGELLSGQPGVSSTYFGPGASRPVIRGLGGDRIRMLTDGVGTIDASVTSPDHAVAIDPLLIERVEIVRGPATLLYGGNAVGGVVNVIDHRIHTTRPGDVFNARIETRAASASDERSGGAVIEGGTGPLAWHLDAYRREADDVEIPGFAESAARRAEEAAEAAEHGEEAPTEIAGHIPNTALTADGGAFGLSLIGDPGHRGVAYSGHSTVYGVPAGAHAHHGEHPEDGEGAVRIDLRQRRVDLQGALTQPFGIVNEARFKLGLARYRHTEHEGDEIGTVFRNRGFDSRVELLHSALGAFTGAAGWQGGRSDFEAIGDEAFLPPSRTTTHALFLFEEAKLSPFTWQLGARVERQALDLRDGTGVSRDENTFSASTGVVWVLDDTWTLGVSLAQAERAPNAQDLFANGPHIGTNAYEIGDPDLDAEESLALDLTLRKRLGFVTGSLSVFSNRFDGYLFEQPTGLLAVEHEGEIEFVSPDDEEAEHGGLPVYRFVQHDAQFYGAELESIFHLQHTDRHQLDLVVGADFVRARDTTADTNLPRITPRRVKSGLVWASGPWSLGGEVQFVERQDRVAADETPTAGYELVSAYVSYRLTFERAVFDVFARGTNLGDAEARMHTSFLKDVAPLPGRSVTVGIRASF